MNQLTKAAISNLEAKECDSTFVKFSIYLVAVVFTVVFAVQAIEQLAK